MIHPTARVRTGMVSVMILLQLIFVIKRGSLSVSGTRRVLGWQSGRVLAELRDAELYNSINSVVRWLPCSGQIPSSSACLFCISRADLAAGPQHCVQLRSDCPTPPSRPRNVSPAVLFSRLCPVLCCFFPISGQHEPTTWFLAEHEVSRRVQTSSIIGPLRLRRCFCCCGGGVNGHREEAEDGSRDEKGGDAEHDGGEELWIRMLVEISDGKGDEGRALEFVQAAPDVDRQAEVD